MMVLCISVPVVEGLLILWLFEASGWSWYNYYLSQQVFLLVFMLVVELFSLQDYNLHLNSLSRNKRVSPIILLHDILIFGQGSHSCLFCDSYHIKSKCPESPYWGDGQHIQLINKSHFLNEPFKLDKPSGLLGSLP